MKRQYSWIIWLRQIHIKFFFVFTFYFSFSFDDYVEHLVASTELNSNWQDFLCECVLVWFSRLLLGHYCNALFSSIAHHFKIAYQM